jgi:putative hemolysin
MSKYLVLFNSSTTAQEQMANATPEQMQASMKEWMDWQQEAVKTIGFEWGLPIQAVAQVTTTEITGSANKASGYCIMEGKKDMVSKLLQSHPHLKREGATVDLLEMIPMPGM